MSQNQGEGQGMAQQEKTFGMLCHLLAAAGFVFPFGNILGPLVMWLVKKDEFPFVNSQGKESLNFQISVTIYAICAGALSIVGIGLVLLPVVAVFSLVMVILATIQANNGVGYTYPLCIRLIK
jgi:uncharacterized Tic20 family protein